MNPASLAGVTGTHPPDALGGLRQHACAGTILILGRASLLQHDQAKMRKRAAAVLAVIGPDASATAADIAQALGQEKDATVRSALLRAYGQVEQDQDALAKVLLEAMDDMSADYYALAIRLAGEPSAPARARTPRTSTSGSPALLAGVPPAPARTHMTRRLALRSPWRLYAGREAAYKAAVV